MVLEQSVNADDASRLTGVSTLTNSDLARKLYMITWSVKIKFDRNLKQLADIKEIPDSIKEL